MSRLETTHFLLGLKEGEPVPELPTLICDVKGSIVGSSDPWPTEELHKVKEALEYRVKEWYKSDDIIDNLIYVMCIECIRMIRAEIRERVNP